MKELSSEFGMKLNEKKCGILKVARKYSKEKENDIYGIPFVK